MTIKKAQQNHQILNQGVTHMMILNHGVRKFWIYWTLHLLTLWTYMEHLGNFDYFLGLCIVDGHFSIISFQQGRI